MRIAVTERIDWGERLHFWLGVFGGMIIGVLATIFWMMPAHAKDIAPVLNEDEQRALYQIIDAAVKSKGIELVPVAHYFMQKLQAAAEGKGEPAKPAEDKK